MKKEKIILPDGRYLIYFNFKKDKTGGNGASGECCSCKCAKASQAIMGGKK